MAFLNIFAEPIKIFHQLKIFEVNVIRTVPTHGIAVPILGKDAGSNHAGTFKSL